MTGYAPPEPLLRTLSPLLRNLEGKLRSCLEMERRYRIDLIRKASLEGIAADLKRQAEALDVDRPLMIVMFMGGTGVGKSTLLNALAGSIIAQAAVTRPTTRDPVVYLHNSVKPERLDPALRNCRIVTHDREALVQKVLVDTPDLDSTDLSNREKLKSLLPIADIVLYVGSQEKYHDQLGWELFQSQRQRRAFAFVLNKWDRCLHPGASGLRPDEDLLRDLKREGFENPILFRTTAQRWLDHPNGQVPPDLPEGEQFAQLVHWLENGLTRLEIEAVKARGVGQLLAQLDNDLSSVSPPDLDDAADATRKAWQKILDEEAEADTEILLNTLDPHQPEIEHHFSVQGQQRFTGPMRWYLKAFTGVKYAGTTLRDRVPLMPRIGPRIEVPQTWDVQSFTRECCRVAGERSLDRRGTARTSRLLVEANESGFPLHVLAEPTEVVAKQDWRKRYDQALSEALLAAERVWVMPTGPRRLLQLGLVSLANFLPIVAFVAAYLILLWRVYINSYLPTTFDIVMPFVLTLIVLMLLHLLITLLLPMRWPAIRGEFRRQLESRLSDLLQSSFAPIPRQIADILKRERAIIEELRRDVQEVDRWLAQRQQQANIASLYGSALIPTESSV
jgi:energy-coupling factor transporter ATP-binding protein EcfA2